MKKIITLFALICSLSVFGQEFELTPDNFKCKTDKVNDYVILEMPGYSKQELFNKSKEFINQYYNNPKYVTAESENDQLVVNAFGSKYNMTLMSWYNEYQIELLFKDDKIKLTPKFKWIKNYNGGDNLPLVLSSGYLWAVFNKKGKVMREKAKETAESDIKEFIKGLHEKISSKNDW
ncbi:DUF4468 domain-containing protein [Chryseobacterium indologenes]|uniref:DUF4468 domain-containing protein n=1 Tax=Chryseobacterium indologenes TaxID=253 RepID=A0A0N0IW12_CHRID|nr:DUF4468 domain-containing protein [Chryseobacterium indologenes]KPE50993.1 hypothetical protein AOB46_12450 [Chryseobacterium indologenes]